MGPHGCALGAAHASLAAIRSSQAAQESAHLHGGPANSQPQFELFTCELTPRSRNIRTEVLNPTVRTRKHEVVSCCIAVSNKPNPLKPALPKKRSACAKKPSCLHPARYARKLSAKPDTPKQPLI